MAMFGRILGVFAGLGLLLAVPAGAAPERKTPYWASIAAGKALMRTGPGRNFPSVWLYQRAGLPVKVVEVYPSWRKVVDPDGATGWMMVNLLSDERTGFVTGAAREVRAAPDRAAKLLWRVEPGVVGKLSHCGGGWCAFDVNGRVGYVETAGLWGVDVNEVIDD